MKKILIYLFSLFMVTSFFVSCSEDELNSESVIIDKSTVTNDFDKWIAENYTKPYNVAFWYRADDREYSMDFTLTPPIYEKSISMAKILHHLWLGTYDDVKGIGFTRAYIPKVIMVVGSGAYSSTSVKVGEAEGGMKITFYRINQMELAHPNLSELVGVPSFAGNGVDETGLIKTAFHEFAHIMAQNKPLPEDFALISDKDYTGDDWNASGTTPLAAWKKGFTTKYGSSSPGEDFAEIVGIYITRGKKNWDDLLAAAGTDGAAILTQKVNAINDYLKTSWGASVEGDPLSLNVFRAAFEQRAAELSSLDLENVN
jgi:substrate import-associated zinc metallohydrolase lipoprotein